MDSSVVECVVVPSKDAEATRRQLDRAGLLSSQHRIMRTDDGAVALPLSAPSAASTMAAISAVTAGLKVMALPMSSAAPQKLGQHVALYDTALSALESAGLTREAAAALLPQAAMPQRWEKLGDVVLFAPKGLFDPDSEAGRALSAISSAARGALYSALARDLRCSRIGVQGRVRPELNRKSSAELLWPAGASGWTLHRENGITFGLDVTRSMFSSGNGTEKARVANRHCEGECVVDLYAGIGYFTLSYLVHAHAAHVHACEWDEDALVALNHNLSANGVAQRCTVYPGDNALSAPKLEGLAHRVNLGLIPSSEQGWPLAVRALRLDGGWLHVHANVSQDDEERWSDELLVRLTKFAREAGRAWVVRLEHVERVKSYAPRVNHVVADVCCRQEQKIGT